MARFDRNLRFGLNLVLLGAFIVGFSFGATPTRPVFAGASSPDTPQPGPQYTVNDPADPGGAVCSIALCSLRAAITSANAGAGHHSIIFNLVYPVTITLSSALPTISGSLTIAGPGSANLVLSGAGLYRVLKAGSGSNLHLSGVAIRDGSDTIQGGGILVDHGSLTLQDTIIANSVAGGGNGGGLNNIGGIVDISYTTFDSNNAFHDGGITNSGSITINNSLFINNTARTGGAIDNSGTLIVTNSTFSGNVAGVISGGAIQNSGTLVVANSTFNQNGSSNGADIANGGTLNVTNSTFYGAILPSGSSIANGGAGAVVTLRNTILAASAGVNNCSNLGGVLTANTFNLATDATCASATVKTLLQLKLGPMENNGGSTPTIGLLPGSFAIDSGDDAVCVALVGAPSYGAGGVDQRGVSRPQGPHCDAGSFEADFQTGTNLIVNTPADPGAVLCTLASCSLRSAITEANLGGMAGVHTIGFNLAYPVTITLTSPLPAITGTLTIAGPGAADLGVSGDDLYRVIEVGSGSALSMKDFAIRHGNVIDQGGGIFNDHGTLSIANMVIAENTAGGGNGGGLNNAGGIVKISKTVFADNLGFHDGGITNSGSMTVAMSTFSGNHARTGGAIDNSGTLTITGTTFNDNVADPISGGAIQNSGGLVLANSTFFNNGSPVGGDIDNASGALNITNSTFFSDTLPTASSIDNTGAGTKTTLRNTILAAGSGINNCATSGGAALTADSSNLATDSTCASATLTTLVQLKLGGLNHNGGETLTIALLHGSVAIDAGNDSVCAAAVGAPDYGAGGVDQRGVPRPQGPHCDVGAFEYYLVRNFFLPLIFR